jgi:hypothetical protein
MSISGLREAVMADTTTMRSYPFGPVRGLEIDPMYFRPQEHEPLARVKLPYGEEGWLLTRYDDVRTAPRPGWRTAGVRSRAHVAGSRVPTDCYALIARVPG